MFSDKISFKAVITVTSVKNKCFDTLSSLYFL